MGESKKFQLCGIEGKLVIINYGESINLDGLIIRQLPLGCPSTIYKAGGTWMLLSSFTECYPNLIVGMYTVSKVSDHIGIIKLIPISYQNDR